ncbi:MAG: Rne/Rng family ribonuclease [Alphaproteobacteria bacterium]|nr:Rne/Rng family ribonuclease [Alphaproteobacteria bacterium]
MSNGSAGGAPRGQDKGRERKPKGPPREVIVSTTGREVRVALVENGRLAELHIDRGDERGFVGNVYLGRVVRVLPGMQAAFVDIGLERAAFLYVGDIFQDFLHMHEEGPVPVDDEEEPSEGKPPASEDKPRANARAGQPQIQDLLKEGQEIVVQVAKDPIGTKGARLTTHIALPGRFLVFMPTVEHVGISRRIDRDKERRRLRDFVEKHRKKGMGYIVRTVCEGAPTEALRADMLFLERTWQRIQDTCKGKKAPSLLHSEYGLVLRGVRDGFDNNVERMVIDDKRTWEDVRSFMDDFMPSAKERVHLYRGTEPIFDVYGVEPEVQRSMGRKVWLKSGGYLVIDQTEALMAIDVNSGKYVGSSSLEDTTLKINLEAVDEIVAQLRLRNIGGLIIIDFIDMDREQNRDKVYRALEDALKHDRARTNVLRISDLGLVEMTRKRVQEGLDRYLRESCPICDGTGQIRSHHTLVYEILREVKRETGRSQGSLPIYVNTTPAVAELLYGERFQDLEQIEAQTGRRIVIRALAHLHPEQFEVYAR